MLYSGFSKDQGAFIATPEKALLDSIYLASIGRYTPDLASLDLGKLDRKKLAFIASKYPSKTKNFLERMYEKARRS
jgi:hypothetical protein